MRLFAAAVFLFLAGAPAHAQNGVLEPFAEASVSGAASLGGPGYDESASSAAESVEVAGDEIAAEGTSEAGAASLGGSQPAIEVSASVVGAADATSFAVASASAHQVYFFAVRPAPSSEPPLELGDPVQVAFTYRLEGEAAAAATGGANGADPELRADGTVQVTVAPGLVADLQDELTVDAVAPEIPSADSRELTATLAVPFDQVVTVDLDGELVLLVSGLSGTAAATLRADSSVAIDPAEPLRDDLVLELIAVPEPDALLALGIALAGVARLRVRRAAGR